EVRVVNRPRIDDRRHKFGVIQILLDQFLDYRPILGPYSLLAVGFHQSDEPAERMREPAYLSRGLTDQRFHECRYARPFEGLKFGSELSSNPEHRDSQRRVILVLGLSDDDAFL